ncbi:OmpA family protein [Fulvivirgaceae bacterium BMA12]|uniref:OmpA family protein n=1 Tax=Agaribacillus aureus TaxID=3051825 RepID=A0ABT8LG45_9BACT|nr:OmpA family protein [Fulvivirgaceae bacterium BMA12]
MTSTQVSLASSVEHSLPQDSLVAKNFIVIGTYREEINAIAHVNKARLYIKSAGYFFNSLKDSYYVFAYQSTDKRATLAKLHELRTYAYFSEAWYYKHQPGQVRTNIHLANNPVSKAPQPVLGDLISPKKALVTTNPRSPATETERENAPSTEITIQKTKAPDPPEVKTDLIADSRSDAISKNLNRNLPPITSESVVLEVKEPEESAIDQLQTGKSGDVIIFNNLLFHRNAAILQQSSESNLKKLLSIMTDNPAMRIKIHGHTNGDFRGEIVTMGKRDKNYFRTSSKNNYIKGDAVMLSMERAKVIKKYLKEKGILPGRVETKGWGGQKTIYPMSSPTASYNSRVEIEILEK